MSNIEDHRCSRLWLKYWTLNDFRMIKVACVIFTHGGFSRKDKLLYLVLVHRKLISVSFRTCNMLMFIKRLPNWSHDMMVTVSGWYTLSPTLHGCVLHIIVYSLYFVITRMTHLRSRPILKRMTTHKCIEIETGLVYSNAKIQST